MVRSLGKPLSSGLVHLAIVLLVCGALTGCWRGAEPMSGENIDHALEAFQLGETAAAIERLEAVMAADPEGRLGDRAALVQGNLLIKCHQHLDSLRSLSRVGGGLVAPQYARLLKTRAIVEGFLEAHYDEATNLASDLVAAGE